MYLHDPVPNAHYAAVEDHQAEEQTCQHTKSLLAWKCLDFRDVLEVGVEVFPQRDVAAIVDVHWWLNEDSFTDLAEILLEHLLSIRSERLRSGIIWEMVVVFVHEFPCTETALRQFGGLGIVSDLIVSAGSLNIGNLLCGDNWSYKTPDIIFS